MWWLGGFLILLPAAQTRAYFPQGVTMDKGCWLSCSKAALDCPTGASRVLHSLPHPHASYASGLPPHLIWGWPGQAIRPQGRESGDSWVLASSLHGVTGSFPFLLLPRDALSHGDTPCCVLWLQGIMKRAEFILNSYCGSKHHCPFFCACKTDRHKHTYPPPHTLMHIHRNLSKQFKYDPSLENVHPNT